MANGLKSNKGSQIIKVIEGNGVVTIWAYDTKQHVANSVTIFDELLIGVASKLSAIMLQRRKLTQRAPDAGESAASQTLSPQSGESTPEVDPAATQRR